MTEDVCRFFGYFLCTRTGAAHNKKNQGYSQIDWVYVRIDKFNPQLYSRVRRADAPSYRSKEGCWFQI